MIAHFAAVARGPDALTVEDGRRRAAAFGVGLPGQGAQGTVQRSPPALQGPLSENMEDCSEILKISWERNLRRGMASVRGGHFASNVRP